MADAEVTEEIELISRERGKRLAEAWVKDPRKLGIPDTLLNSKDIRTVVEATGLIAPFYDLEIRVKKAAYEGRIGSKAYIFKERNCPEQMFDSSKDEFLVLPRNSIVFVECDLDFRLPDFIAARFNLQIQHVHRGLLLGTGPLVDPGYWGKLCIPLHNLTDQDYEIPQDKGLIWIEFTKTTLSTDQEDPARVPLETKSRDTTGHWDIEEFLHKAANQYRGYKVPIKSSLPTMFDEATSAAKKSADDAKSAKDDAKLALDVADKFRYYNFLSMIAAAIGFVAVCFGAIGFLTNISMRNEDIATKLKTEAENAQDLIEQHIKDVDRYGRQTPEARSSVPALRGVVDQQQREIRTLKIQVGTLKREMAQIRKKKDPNRPAG